jgi:hypothetical protein
LNFFGIYSSFYLLNWYMGKQLQNSLSSLPYALCMKLTWKLFITPWIVVINYQKEGDWKHLGP